MCFHCGGFSSTLILLSMDGVLYEFTLLHPAIQPWLFHFLTRLYTGFVELCSTTPVENTSQILRSDRSVNSKVNLPKGKPLSPSPSCSTLFILMQSYVFFSSIACGINKPYATTSRRNRHIYIFVQLFYTVSDIFPFSI